MSGFIMPSEMLFHNVPDAVSGNEKLFEELAYK